MYVYTYFIHGIISVYHEIATSAYLEVGNVPINRWDVGLGWIWHHFGQRISASTWRDPMPAPCMARAATWPRTAPRLAAQRFQMAGRRRLTLLKHMGYPLVICYIDIAIENDHLQWGFP